MYRTGLKGRMAGRSAAAAGLRSARESELKYMERGNYPSKLHMWAIYGGSPTTSGRKPSAFVGG